MPKKSINLIYKFNGDVESINLFEIAPILLSVGQLIQDSNKVIYPDAEDIGINAKPFDKGSFVIEIVLFAKTNLQHLLSFVNSQEGQRIKELLEFIGLIVTISGASCGGLIGFIHFLKGKPPQKIEEINKDESRVTTSDGKSITVKNSVINLYSSPNIRKNISNALVRPLEQDQVETIESYLKEEREKTVVTINKEIKGYIKEYAALEQVELENKEIIEELYISPKRGSFSGEANSWSFRRSTNSDIITVHVISDDNFLEKCKQGAIRPFEKDMLRVKLKTIYDPETMRAKRTEIMRVLEYIPFKDKQLKMDI